MAERMSAFPAFIGQGLDMFLPGDAFNPRGSSFGQGFRTSDWGRFLGDRDVGAGAAVLTDILASGVPILNVFNRGGAAGNAVEEIVDNASGGWGDFLARLFNRNNPTQYNAQHSMPSFSGFSPYGPYASGYKLPEQSDGSSTSDSVMGYLGMNDYGNPSAYLNTPPAMPSGSGWQSSGINGGFGSWGGGGAAGGVGGGFGMGGAGSWSGGTGSGAGGAQSKFASKYYFDIE